MSKELVISAASHETRVAILEDGQLCEIYIEREKEFALVGSIYKGRVTRVLPGMQSAFVEIGLDSDAFLYVSDFLENLEEYDHVVSAVEGKVQKMEQQGGRVFVPPAEIAPIAAPPPSESLPIEPQTAEPQAFEPAPAAAAPLTEPSEAPIILPGETIQPRAPGSSAPVHHPPFETRDRGGRGGFGRDRRGGPGGRRGGSGSGGRFGRSGGHGRDPRHGRDLPPSKYASSRPYEPRESRPPQDFGPPPRDEQIILPGESLAKYRDRMAAAPAAPPEHFAPPSEAHHEDVSTPEVAGDFRSAGIEPVDFVTPSIEQVASPMKEHPIEEHAESFAPAAETFFSEPTATPAHVEEPSRLPPTAYFDAEVTPATHPEEPEHESAPAPQHTNGFLSEEEAAALGEQLAEAKHEEAQDEADAKAEADAAEAAGLAEDEHEENSQVIEEATYAVEGLEEPFEREGVEMSAEPPADGADAHPEIPHAEPSHESRPQPTSARVEDRSRARFQRPMRRGGRPQRDRGGRPMRHQGGHRQEAPRRPQLISEMLKANEEIIVQIAKEPLGKKGARITSHVALPGRFLVYMPTVNHIGVSRKIASADDRSRLRRIVNEAKGTFPGGFIVRTAAGGATDEEIRADVEFLGHTWEEILKRAEQRKAPALLHRDLNLVERILRDYMSTEYTAIWIDNEEEYGKVVEFVSRFQPKLVSRVKLYTKDAPIFEEFGIQQELDKALRPKVWLKSGGYIVINHTEALVAIDVNTGKYVGRGSTRLEDTIVKTNLEAVKEIVRQIRLRDLGGIIVVDFIDMEERRNREKVLFALEDALRADRAPSKVLPFNEFGLVAITRKRTKQALERVLCQPCPYCTGSGMVKSIPTICYEIQAEARKMAGELDSQSVTLRVNPEIAKALKTREATMVEELEQATRKSVIIQSDPTLHWEQYDIY
jgi:ribonuclease G